MQVAKSFLKSAIGSAVAGALALGASSALASHVQGVSFLEQSFTVNPMAVGETQGPFQARFIDFSYRADVDQTSAGAFTETGVGFFSTFQSDLGAPISANTTGLNSAYKLYATFDGTGTTTASGTGGVDGQFTTFNVTFFVDRNADTNFADASSARGSSLALTGVGDDTAVLNGTLRVGGFHVFGGLANGDFDVQFNATPVGGFFGGAAFAGGSAIGDFNGVNTRIEGVAPPPGSFVRARIIGSGNTSFAAVPEPGSLALLGLGMLALAPVARRRKA